MRRSLVIVLNTVFGNVLFYSLLGLLNRALPSHPIRSIFLFYSVNEAYLKTMIYPWYAPVVKWRPGLGQVIKQGPYWCLSFGITANENDYYDPANGNSLARLHSDVDKIRKIIGARQMTFSGILPGIFMARGLMDEAESPENKNTVMAVLSAISKVMKKEQIPVNSPIVVLGGKGYIGSKIVDALSVQGKPVYTVDIKGVRTSKFPSEIAGRPSVVLNVTKKGALKEYIPQLWKEIILVNEVYPEPDKDELEAMRGKGIRCYHISGVSGNAVPGFLRAYHGAIPCCASYLPDEDFDVVIRQLT